MGVDEVDLATQSVFVRKFVELFYKCSEPLRIKPFLSEEKGYIVRIVESHFDIADTKNRFAE